MSNLTDEQLAKCREAFEKWLALQHGSHSSFDKHRMGRAWQAAWSAAQAGQDALVQNLAMLCKRMAHRLSNCEGSGNMHEVAIEFLTKNNLQGSPLRDATPPTQPSEGGGE